MTLQLFPDKRHVHTDTAMRLPDEFVSNGKTKLDLENDCCMVEVNNIGLSDFQKLKKAKQEQTRRKWMIGSLSICLPLSVILSAYSVYNVQQLSLTLQLMVQEEDLSYQSSLSLKTVDDGEREVLPPMFDCTRTSVFQGRGTVSYDDCLVNTTGGSMNITSGIFTASPSQRGIYQISFTAKYVAHSNGRFGAWSDILVNNLVIADSQREYNGYGGKSRTESSTHTMIALYPILEDDTIRVKFHKDGYSYIHSDSDHDVHFTARKVSDLPVGYLRPNNVI